MELSNRTPLVLAAQFGHEQVIRLLVDHGANILAADNKRCTALDFTIMRGSRNLAEYLLDHGAKLESIYVDGPTPRWRRPNMARLQWPNCYWHAGPT